MVQVRLLNLTKTFGSVRAVDDVTIEVAEGELFFLLGPSGCGKTTILRTIAGFETPDSGAVLFDGRDVTGDPPHKRNTGMVFQNYALWPHMSVRRNVGYGLRVRKLPSAEIDSRVSDALEMVRMGGLAERFPNQLSGGQQQRVALARALVVRPECLLLDEPLSNLDAKLRLEMRDEIKRIHSQTGITTIYVTHDQKEALSMAGRLAVVADGKIVQTGAPEEVYHNPASLFVASFVGETNAFEGNVTAAEGPLVCVETELGALWGRPAGPDVKPGARAVLTVRPEMLAAADPHCECNLIRAKVEEFTFLGEVAQLVLVAGPCRVKVLVMAPSGSEKPESLTFAPESALVFPAAEGDGGAGA